MFTQINKLLNMFFNHYMGAKNNFSKTENYSEQWKNEMSAKIQIDDSWLIPVKQGQAVSEGWPYTDGIPAGVTWHWTAGWTRESCDRTIGGSKPERKGSASAHYCVGRTFEEGISQYVSLHNRSWHAGKNQSLKWDGQPAIKNGELLSATRTTIGIETVNIGFERDKIKKESDWIKVFTPNGKASMLVQPWTEEQIEMMIYLGKIIVEEYPHIKYTDHHGHMDVCPGYKEDCSLAFPFKKVLSGIYNEDVPDVWTPYLTIEGRQQALLNLGYNLGEAGVDGDWGRISDSALKAFQKDDGLVVNGKWTTFVGWAIHNRK
jgi:N-acetyl-anhydromuramyl-L-alanine amidase AmpD